MRTWSERVSRPCPEEAKPDKPGGPGNDVGSSVDITEKGKMKLPNLDFDGAFLSMKLSMNLLDSYFIFQAGNSRCDDSTQFPKC